MDTTQPASAGDTLPPPTSPPARAEPPTFTYGLVVVLLIIYGCELLASPGASPVDGPSAQVLTALGGTMRQLVATGQYWRLLTAPFLHAGLLHVGFNCLALWLVGRLLEPIIGVRWMAATFAVSAVAGAAASMLANPPNVVGVGASGGIVGLFVIAVFVALREPDRRMQSRMIRTAVGTLIPTLLPQLSHGAAAGATLVDYADHIGGAIAGAMLGVLLLLSATTDTTRRLGAQAAGVIGTAFFVAALLAVGPALASVREYRSISLDWPAANTDWEAGIEQKVQQYPDDPRILMLYATHLYKAGNKAQARTELEAALAQTAALRDYFDPKLTIAIKAMYAGLLDETGEHDRARQIFAELCGADDPPDIKALLARAKAC